MSTIETTRPPSTREASAPTPLIPVKEIRFRKGIDPDLAGKHGTSGLRSGEPGVNSYCRIFYDPRIRHHRVEYYKPGAKTPEVTLVPEDWCLWVPA